MQSVKICVKFQQYWSKPPMRPDRNQTRYEKLGLIKIDLRNGFGIGLDMVTPNPSI